MITLNIIAELFGFLGLIAIGVGVNQKKKILVLTFVIIANVMFAVEYIVLNAWIRLNILPCWSG